MPTWGNDVNGLAGTSKLNLATFSGCRSGSVPGGSRDQAGSEKQKSKNACPAGTGFRNSGSRSVQRSGFAPIFLLKKREGVSRKSFEASNSGSFDGYRASNQRSK